MSLSTINDTSAALDTLSDSDLLRIAAAPAASIGTESSLRPFTPAVALASAARTVTTQSSWVRVPNWARGMVVEMECTTAPGLGSIKPRISGRRSVAAFSSRILVDDTTGLAASTGIRTLLATNQGINSTFLSQVDFDLVYPEVSITITHATADSYTYSVSYWFLP